MKTIQSTKTIGSNATGSGTISRLFSPDLPTREWTEFKVEGFTAPVCGVVYRTDNPPVSGMPLGGLGTGCLDLDPTGRWGYSTLFSHAAGHDWSSATTPGRSRGKLDAPFLGLVMDGEVWVMAKHAMSGVRAPSEISYWGHYPVADLEYTLDAPISVGVRAWTPFLPGDTPTSNTPGAVLEVRLRNDSRTLQFPRLVFAFPGACQEAERAARFQRSPLSGNLTGVWVQGDNGMNYAMAVMGAKADEVGGSIATEGAAWASVSKALPHAGETDAGASLAFTVEVPPGKETIVHLLLAWYAPHWEAYQLKYGQKGGVSPDEALFVPNARRYRHKYAERHRDARDVAEFLGSEHKSLLRRILAWQQEFYTETDIPLWMRDTLLNSMHLLAENAFWAAAGPPLGDWVRPEDGLFGLCESAVSDAQIECIPCSWYGNMPLVYFFPDLALSTLRGYVAYMTPEGAVPFFWGQGFDMVTPNTERQKSLNGLCFVDLVERLWRLTGNDAILTEFYPAVKKVTEYSMTFRPDEQSVISVAPGPKGGPGDEWFENGNFYGMVAHVAGVRLAQLHLTERMAEFMNDDAFAARCREWFSTGSRLLEKELWNGDNYLLYSEPEIGQRSDNILAYQLDGEWMRYFHRLPNVFQPDRVPIVIDTIDHHLNAISESGPIFTCHHDGSLLPQKPAGDCGERQTGMAWWPSQTFILASLCLYIGRNELGLEMARKCIQTLICKLGFQFDMPNILNATVGQERTLYGCDYYQALTFWFLLPAAHHQTLDGPCRSGGLINRVLKASKLD